MLSRFFIQDVGIRDLSKGKPNVDECDKALHEAADVDGGVEIVVKLDHLRIKVL